MGCGAITVSTVVCNDCYLVVGFSWLHSIGYLFYGYRVCHTVTGLVGTVCIAFRFGLGNDWHILEWILCCAMPRT